MNRQRARLATEAGGARRFPRPPAVEGVVQPWLFHARAGRRVPDVYRVCVPTRREKVEIALAFEAELLPCLAAVAAAQEPERIDQARTGRRMAAAVETFPGRREAHVIVLRSGRLRPFPAFVHRETVMARDHQPFSVGAVGEAVHMHERDLRCGLRSDRRRETDKDPMCRFHRLSSLRVISARASKTARDLQWLLI